MQLLKNAELLLLKTIDMKRFFIVLFVLLTLKGTAQSGYSPEQMQVWMKMLSLKNSLIAKDSVTLSNLLADDVTYGHSNGLNQTKAQLIRDVVSGVQDYKRIEAEDINVRIFERTAIVNMRSWVNMIYNNNPLDLTMNITLVWIQKDGEWKLEARQSVKLN
jgi:hypothetical protein